jgi:hypothetical protein
LADGRSVVIKAHQPHRSEGFLNEIVRLQSLVADKAGFAAKVIAAPLPLGRGLAIVEEYRAVGAARESHEPEVRRLLVRGLYNIVRVCDPFVSTTPLPELMRPGPGALWPTPHGKLFDFEATARGAEWIDEIAVLARSRMNPSGKRVIGHCDWRQEHVRFGGDEIVVAYDWDALVCDFEPILVGTTAHAFCADWSQPNRKQAPTLEEARAFKQEYELLRGSSFSRDEIQLFAAFFAYACAYTARCGHAIGADERDKPGSFQHLIWQERERLLDV